MSVLSGVGQDRSNNALLYGATEMHLSCPTPGVSSAQSAMYDDMDSLFMYSDGMDICALQENSCSGSGFDVPLASESPLGLEHVNEEKQRWSDNIWSRSPRGGVPEDFNVASGVSFADLVDSSETSLSDDTCVTVHMADALHRPSASGLEHVNEEKQRWSDNIWSRSPRGGVPEDLNVASGVSFADLMDSSETSLSDDTCVTVHMADALHRPSASSSVNSARQPPENQHSSPGHLSTDASVRRTPDPVATVAREAKRAVDADVMQYCQVGVPPCQCVVALGGGGWRAARGCRLSSYLWIGTR